ncbi:uncharacterized protein Fot_09183 [Forsythia ovata]|uniref:SP-RING-type domain-containing protein n=1 Tax=Forsythia ovata TaxID=205694 RepID=A0ABD1WFZ2_9LAMI
MAPVVVIQTNGSGTEAPANQSDRISRRIHDVAGLLFVNICNAPNNDSAAFFNLCISLARCIDFAIAHEEVPSKAGVLLSLLKKVCQCKNNNLLQAAIMVLMISAKNACQSGWFSDRDSEELRILFKEMRSNFCTVSNLITEPSSSVSIIPAIMSRFYPTMRMGHIFASLEIKPGYGAFMDDFRISKNTISSPDGIRLFVVQTDNMETSSCLISPPKVNFLMNGEGVERRMNVYADSGPKNPTDVTRMLICGSNLLQAVGEFNGNYIIAVAFVSVRSTPSGDALEHYVQPAPATIDSGPSRISLNCPISLNRIKTPVKGHSCKHLQCFDFENYVSINSRRPSWRCPHCNLHTCFTDIRIDQKMVEVLKEVGKNVTKVIVSSDGSWNAVTEIDDNEKMEDMASNLGQTACENQSTTQNLVIDPQVANTNYINRNSVHVENDFTVGWGPNVSAPQITSVFGSTPNNFYSSSVSTDAITSAPYREAETLHANMHHATSGSQNLIPLPNTLPLQFQYGNPTVSSEHGRLLSTTEHVNRTPIAFQALPAQTPVPVLQQISRNYMNTLIPDTPSATPQVSPAALWNTNGFSKVPCDGGRQQQFSRSHSNQLEVSQMASSSVPQYPGIQPPSTYQGPSLESMSRRMSQAMYQSLGLIQPSLQPNANFSQPQVHQRGPHRGIGQSTGASGSHQALNNSLGSIQSSMQTNVNFSQPHVHQRGPQSGIGQATGAIGSHQAMNSALGSIQSTMPLNANFLQPQVHQRGPQSGTGQATGATGNHQAMKHSLGSMGPQSGTGQATGVTGNHQAMKHSLGSMQSSMQLNANFSKPQVHERGPQSGIGQATGATGSHQAMNYSLGSIQSSLQSNADLSQPQVHPRGPQSGTDRATGAIGSQQDRLTIAAQRNVNAQVTRPLETSRMMPMFQISADGCRVPSPGGASLPVTRH